MIANIANDIENAEEGFLYDLDILTPRGVRKVRGTFINVDSDKMIVEFEPAGYRYHTRIELSYAEILKVEGAEGG